MVIEAAAYFDKPLLGDAVEPNEISEEEMEALLEAVEESNAPGAGITFSNILDDV